MTDGGGHLFAGLDVAWKDPAEAPDADRPPPLAGAQARGGTAGDGTAANAGDAGEESEESDDEPPPPPSAMMQSALGGRLG